MFVHEGEDAKELRQIKIEPCSGQYGEIADRYGTQPARVLKDA